MTTTILMMKKIFLILKNPSYIMSRRSSENGLSTQGNKCLDEKKASEHSLRFNLNISHYCDRDYIIRKKIMKVPIQMEKHPSSAKIAFNKAALIFLVDQRLRDSHEA